MKTYFNLNKVYLLHLTIPINPVSFVSGTGREETFDIGETGLRQGYPYRFWHGGGPVPPHSGGT